MVIGTIVGTLYVGLSSKCLVIMALYIEPLYLLLHVLVAKSVHDEMRCGLYVVGKLSWSQMYVVTYVCG